MSKFYIERPSATALKYVHDYFGISLPCIFQGRPEGDELIVENGSVAGSRLPASDWIECDPPIKGITQRKLLHKWREMGLSIPKECRRLENVRTFIEVPTKFPFPRFSRISKYSGGDYLLLQGEIEPGKNRIQLLGPRKHPYHDNYKPMPSFLWPDEVVEVDEFPGPRSYEDWRAILIKLGLVRKLTDEQIAELRSDQRANEFWHYERISGTCCLKPPPGEHK